MNWSTSDVSDAGRAIDFGDSRTAAGIVGGGVLLVFLGRVFGSSLLRATGVLTAIAGAGLFARLRFEERANRIKEAASHIREELDDLDPVAKAQVVADLAREQ